MTAKPKLVFEIDQSQAGTICIDIREVARYHTSDYVDDDPNLNMRLHALRDRGFKHFYCSTYHSRALNIRMRWERFNDTWVEPNIAHSDRVESFATVARFFARMSRVITKHTGRRGWLKQGETLSGFYLKPEVVLGALMAMKAIHVRYEALPEVSEYAGETVAA